VSDHDVSVEGDGENGEKGDGDQAVPQQGQQDAEGVAVAPRPLPEQRRHQRQVEAAQHQVGHAQVDDEHSGRVPHLKHNHRKHVSLLPKKILGQFNLILL